MSVTAEIVVGEEDIASLDVLEGMAVLGGQKTPVPTQTGSGTSLLTAARNVSILSVLWLGGAALLGLCILLLYQLIWASLGTL
jgi:hypothetical protein